MEHVEALSEGAWSSLNGMCSDEADFMAQLLNNCSQPNEPLSSSHYAASSSPCWHSRESNPNVVGFYEKSIYCSDETNSSFSQGSGYGSMVFPESFYPNTPQQFFVTGSDFVTMGYGDGYLNQDVSNDSMESKENLHEVFHTGKSLQLERGLEMPMPERMEEDKVSCLTEMSNKRPRIHGDIPRSKRSMKLKKSLYLEDRDENEKYSDCKQSKAVLHRQQSSSSSEDDSNVSHELNALASGSGSKGTINSNGKTRANRGSATDPQSLYARKRRERINERLRILQGLVPNGTKVDISTMLEEAVQYVKFLQLQIKLLSSDEHWMYSPIAYNGMDLGLDIRIPTPNPES